MFLRDFITRDFHHVKEFSQIDKERLAEIRKTLNFLHKWKTSVSCTALKFGNG